MTNFKFIVNDKDITNYITSFTWSGDNNEAARKLEFSIAFNNVTKDSSFVNPNIELGDKVVVKYIESLNSLDSKELTLFKGKIWVHNRDTSSYEKRFTAYDDLILLAKSKLNKKFKDSTVLDDIKQVANEWGFNVILDKGVTLDAKGDFIADGMTATEIFTKALSLQTAKDNKKYSIIALDENNNIIIGNNGTKQVANFSLTDKTNIISSSHGESIENLVSLVYIADNNGDTTSDNTVKGEWTYNKFGKITEIYKPDEKVDTKTAATQLLHSVDIEASLSAIGNIYCVAGKSIEIQEENLKGKFFIKTDSHTFQNGQHTMNLTLDFTQIVK